MKKILSIILTLTLLIQITGCTDVDKTEYEQSQKTIELMKEMNNQIGLPNIDDFYEKKTLKEIYELRDDADLITYTYITNLEGKKVYQYTSIGYGIPMSVQYSNPVVYKAVITDEVIQDGGRDWVYSYELVPQAEPNGLFMPEGLSATWIIKVNEDGTREPVYEEREITVVQTKYPVRLCAEWSLPTGYVEGFIAVDERDVVEKSTGDTQE